MIDIHSHFIPEIDDGSETIEESLDALVSMKKMGYSAIVSTPHISIFYMNTRQRISQSHLKLKKAAKKRGINIDLRWGAEYSFESLHESLSNKEKLITIDNMNRRKNAAVLAELPVSLFKPLWMDDTVKKILGRGNRLIIAHPERSMRPGIYRSIFDMEGCYIAVNIPSLTGEHGKSVSENSLGLVKQYGDKTIICSDSHPSLDRMPTTESIRKAASVVGDIQFVRSTIELPSEFIKT